MKKFFLLLLLLFFKIQLVASQSHHVVVSVAPYKYFVEAIAQDTISIELLVPPGASFHDFEPTPQMVLKVVNADIWFRVGELFEEKAMRALKTHNPKMKIVDLREGVDLIIVDDEHAACCHAQGADLHMWLSPKVAKTQAELIAKALSETYPDNKDLYAKNLNIFLQKLDALDQEIRKTLQGLKNRTIMVGHPAYAYFARDYQLKQFPIEYEGKDPTPRKLNEILLRAKNENIKTIFVQGQYNTKGASLIAKELRAKLVILDPYSGDYFISMREIAKKIAEQE